MFRDYASTHGLVSLTPKLYGGSRDRGAPLRVGGSAVDQHEEDGGTGEQQVTAEVSKAGVDDEYDRDRAKKPSCPNAEGARNQKEQRGGSLEPSE